MADFSLIRLFNIAERQLKILRMLKKWRRRRVGYMTEISIDSERRHFEGRNSDKVKMFALASFFIDFEPLQKRKLFP